MSSINDLLLITQRLESRIILLENEINLLKETPATKRKEIYYQKFLEQSLGASHKVTKYGITDISTDDFILRLIMLQNLLEHVL